MNGQPEQEHRITVNTVVGETVTATCSCNAWVYEGLDDGDHGNAELTAAVEAHRRDVLS